MTGPAPRVPQATRNPRHRHPWRPRSARSVGSPSVGRARGSGRPRPPQPSLHRCNPGHSRIGGSCHVTQRHWAASKPALPTEIIFDYQSSETQAGSNWYQAGPRARMCWQNRAGARCAAAVAVGHRGRGACRRRAAVRAACGGLGASASDLHMCYMSLLTPTGACRHGLVGAHPEGRVLTEASGSVNTGVPRDRSGTFEPQIVKKRQRRLNGVNEVVLSFYARGLTTGEN